MSFSRCMRVKDKHKAFSTRCKGSSGKDGFLCDKCKKEAQQHSIFVLMHKEVTRRFHIPFKNQVCVEINLKRKNVPPVTKNETLNKVRDVKTKMLEQLNILKLKKIKWFHDQLGLGIWKQFKENNNEYSLRFHVTKAIIDKLVMLGT